MPQAIEFQPTDKNTAFAFIRTDCLVQDNMLKRHHFTHANLKVHESTLEIKLN